MCWTAQWFICVRVFMEYYHGWMSVLIWQKLQQLENLITRASYIDFLTLCLPERLHIIDVSFSTCRENSSTKHGAEKSEAHCNRPFTAWGSHWGTTATGSHPTMIYTSLLYLRIVVFTVLHTSLLSQTTRSIYKYYLLFFKLLEKELEGCFSPCNIHHYSHRKTHSWTCQEQEVLQVPSWYFNNIHGIVCHAFLAEDI